MSMVPRHYKPSRKERRLGYYIAGARKKGRKHTGKGSEKQQMLAKATRTQAREIKTEPKRGDAVVAEFVSRLTNPEYINNRKLWLANLDAYTRFIAMNLGGNKFRRAVAQLKILRTGKGFREGRLAEALKKRIDLLESIRGFAGNIESAVRERNRERLEGIEREIEREAKIEENPVRRELLRVLLIRIERDRERVR